MPLPPPVAVHFDPYGIDFGNVTELTSSPVQTIKITSTGTSTANITINPSDPRYTATPNGNFSLAPGQFININFQFNATAALGASSATFFTFTGSGPIPGSPLLQANTTVGVASWNVTPNPFNFGSIAIGDLVSQLFTINNTDLVQSLTINSITPNATEFAISGAPAFPFTLTPGTSQTFTISCTAAFRGVNNYPLGVTITPSAGAPINLSLSYSGIAITPAYILTGRAQAVLFSLAGTWNSTLFSRLFQSIVTQTCEVEASLTKMIDFGNPSANTYANRLFMRVDPLGEVAVEVALTSVISEEFTTVTDTKTRAANINDPLGIPDEMIFDVEQNGEIHQVVITVNAFSGILSIQNLIPQFEPRGSLYEQS